MMTIQEIEDALVTMTEMPDGDWLLRADLEANHNLYRGLTPSQASDLYKWGYFQ